MKNSCDHVFGHRVHDRWFRKCFICLSRRVYSSMVRCVECRVLFHVRCVSLEKNDDEQTRNICCYQTTDCCMELVTNTGLIVKTNAVFDVGAASNNKHFTNNVGSQDDAVISSAADKRASVFTVLQQDCKAVSVDVHGTFAASIYITNDSAAGVPETVEQHESIGPSDNEDIVSNVLPVIEVNRAEELNKIYNLWESRYTLFSKFDDGIIVDRESLYSGTPEVLAKLMAYQCKSTSTVMDPFCGTGMIAIQLSMVCRKVIAMDCDPSKVMCARNNARMYGVQGRIEFVVADFFNSGYKIQMVDEIVSSPPENMFILKTAELIRLTSKVAPKALLKLPKHTDKSKLCRLASRHFNHVKMDDISIDRKPTCIIICLGPVTNTNNYCNNKNMPKKESVEVSLFSDGIDVNHQINWISDNNLFAYDDYINEVEEFLKSKIQD